MRPATKKAQFPNEQPHHLRAAAAAMEAGCLKIGRMGFQNMGRGYGSRSLAFLGTWGT